MIRIILFSAVVAAAVIVLFKFCGSNGDSDSNITIKVIPTVEAQTDVGEDSWMRDAKPIATSKPIVAPEPTPEPTVTPEPTSEPVVDPTSEPKPKATPVPSSPVVQESICGSGTLAPVYYGSAPGNIVLSFDDSVGDISRAYAILDVLRTYKVKVAFFPIGSWAALNPELMNRIREDGHLLGSHTTDHADLTTLSSGEIKSQILGGVTDSKLVRPPYGSFNNCVLEVAHEIGFGLAMWNVDPRDWAAASEGKTAEDVRDAVVSGVLANRAADTGSVVVMHFHGSVTLEALPMIIKKLRAEGFTFETIIK